MDAAGTHRWATLDAALDEIDVMNCPVAAAVALRRLAREYGTLPPRAARMYRAALRAARPRYTGRLKELAGAVGMSRSRLSVLTREVAA